MSNSPTPPQGAEVAEVTQADRDAVLAYWNDGPAFTGSDSFVVSVDDAHPLAQAFARHRIAALTAARPAIMEEAAGVADGFHQRALEWAKTVRGLEDYIDETDSSRIATAIRTAGSKTDG